MLCSFFCIVAGMSAVVRAQSPDGGPPAAAEHVFVWVSGPTGTFDALRAAGYDDHDAVWRVARGQEHAGVILPSADLAALRAELPVASLVRVVRSSKPLRDAPRVGRAGPDPRYRTPQEVLAGLNDLATTYPGLAAVYDLQSRYGAPLTHEGRRIHVLRISDNAGIDEDEPSILVFANNHARELNTIEAAFSVAERLLGGYATDPVLRQLVDDHQIWVLPSMNPDGLAYVWSTNDMWRKNRRDNGNGTFGVDLNRNYWFYWGRCGASTNPGSDTYQGPSAGSEPESQAMRAFTLAEGFERMIDVHSYGRDVRHPFNPLLIGQVPNAIAQAYYGMQSAIANGMGYVTRGTCCCGTHMEWHHAAHGTLGQLIEMGTAFQPPFTQTQSEVTRMWPGFREFLTRPVPLRGRVRSVRGGAPVVADLVVRGHQFRNGQRVQSIGRFGRYHLWITPGSYEVEFRAPGHDPQTLVVNLTSGGTVERDVWLVPSARPTTLTAQGAPRLGQTVALDLSSPDDPGAPYFLPVSDAVAPPMALGFGRSLPIARSILLEIELAAPQVFQNVLGVLDGQGRGQGRLAVPADPALVGLTLHFAGVTLDASYLSGVRGITAQSVPLTIAR